MWLCFQTVYLFKLFGMKNVLFCFFALLMLSSCTEVYFDKHPGNRIEEFPNEFLGTYRLILTGNAAVDTGIIEIVKTGIKGTEDGMPRVSGFTDSSFLAKYQRDYFLIIKDKVGFMSIKLAKSGQDILVYFPTVEGENNDALKAAKNFFSNAKLVERDEKMVVLAIYKEKEVMAYFKSKTEADAIKLQFIKK